MLLNQRQFHPRRGTSEAAEDPASKLILAAPTMSTVKLRKAGFGECVDTEEMFLRWFSEMQDMCVLPK